MKFNKGQRVVFVWPDSNKVERGEVETGYSEKWGDQGFFWDGSDYTEILYPGQDMIPEDEWDFANFVGQISGLDAITDEGWETMVDYFLNTIVTNEQLNEEAMQQELDEEMDEFVQRAKWRRDPSNEDEDFEP